MLLILGGCLIGGGLKGLFSQAQKNLDLHATYRTRI